MAKRKYLITISDSDSKRLLKSFKGSQTLLISIACAIVLTIILGTYFLTSRTAIRFTIPGYPTEKSRQMALQAMSKADSLENVINQWNFQMENIRRVLEGREPLPFDSLTVEKQDLEVADRERALYTDSDSILRSEVIGQEKVEVTKKHTGASTSIEGMHFFSPVQGVVTQRYDLAVNHPFIDIAANDGSVVHSILDGTVVAAFWEEMTGNNIVVQHNNDIISIFKHNGKLLKKAGDKVRAGDPLAIVGNTGKLSTGTHLHFELWHKGKPINPETYIKF